MRRHVVARRRHLPGLPAQLRRRQRRRHRRPGRPAGAACLPGRLGRRRDLVQPVVPVADGGRRLRRGRLPGHRPGLRHAGRGGGAASPRRTRSGIRIIIDVVPNHCSDAHPGSGRRWPPGPGSAARELFWFRRAAGDGELPPNDWQSIFGGPAWTQVPDGEWYLHLFAPEQPDFNWANPEVREEFEDVLRFWFDRGVDGVRIDSAAVLVKDLGRRRRPAASPYTDRDEVHDDLPGLAADRRLLPGDRVADRRGLAARPERFARYLRPDELHTAFNFDFLGCPWDAGRAARRRSTRRWPRTRRSARRRPGCCPTTTSPGTSPGTAGPTPRFDFGDRQHGDCRPTWRSACAGPGPRRCSPGAARRRLRLPGRGARPARGRGHPGRAAPGPDLRPLRRHRPGRDGCRVPLPWSGDEPPFGFSPPARRQPWLPQPAGLARPHRRGAGRRPGLDARRSTARAGLRRAEPASATAPLPGWTAARACSRSPATPRPDLRGQPLRRPGRAAGARRRSCWPAVHCRRDAAPGHRRLAARRGVHPGAAGRPPVGGRAGGVGRGPWLTQGSMRRASRSSTRTATG